MYAWGNSHMPLCPAGSLVWASDSARLAGFSSATRAELDLAQKKRSKIVSFLVDLFCSFVCVCVCVVQSEEITIEDFTKNIDDWKIPKIS
jgi:uncharacterized protein YutD